VFPAVQPVRPSESGRRRKTANEGRLLGIAHLVLVEGAVVALKAGTLDVVLGNVPRFDRQPALPGAPTTGCPGVPPGPFEVHGGCSCTSTQFWSKRLVVLQYTPPIPRTRPIIRSAQTEFMLLVVVALDLRARRRSVSSILTRARPDPGQRN